MHTYIDIIYVYIFSSLIEFTRIFQLLSVRSCFVSPSSALHVIHHFTIGLRNDGRIAGRVISLDVSWNIETVDKSPAFCES